MDENIKAFIKNHMYGVIKDSISVLRILDEEKEGITQEPALKHELEKIKKRAEACLN